MDPQTQTWLALAIVGLTVAIFAWRIVAKRKGGAKPGCGGGCGCGGKKPLR